jgi:ribosomal protein S18 acetylase RimI-like enzyme
MNMPPASHARSPASFTLRHDLKPGDLGYIVHLHGLLYAREFGFDPTFEAYVAGPLAEFVRNRGERDQLWLAESGERIVGSVAIVGVSAREAQLRWFLVDPSVRGLGLGRKLLDEAITFSKQRSYATVFLWTVSALTAAAHLYSSAGFQKVEERPARQWGMDLVEERYLLHC